jgi:hypothetical protein
MKKKRKKGGDCAKVGHETAEEDNEKTLRKWNHREKRGNTMSWQDYYKSHVMSAQDAAKILQSGDCFWFPLLMG